VCAHSTGRFPGREAFRAAPLPLLAPALQQGSPRCFKLRSPIGLTTVGCGRVSQPS